MFLSNPCKSFALLLLCAITFQACSASQTNGSKDIALNSESMGRFPFSTKEPEVYQGDLSLTNGASVDHWFVARKGDKWRVDIFRSDEKLVSQIRSGDLFTIDHRKRSYSAIGGDQALPDAGMGNEAVSSFFHGTDYREFVELDSDSTLVNYRARSIRSGTNEVLITVDKPSGLIVRQEFIDRDGTATGLVYEMRNLKLEVDDAVFRIPDGYRKVLP